MLFSMDYDLKTEKSRVIKILVSREEEEEIASPKRHAFARNKVNHTQKDIRSLVRFPIHPRHHFNKRH